MYLQFYNLRRPPFQPAAALEFFWKGQKQARVLDRLQHAVQAGHGVSLLTGDVGSGKTALVHSLRRLLGKSVMTCGISDPQLTAPDFHRLILHALHTRCSSIRPREFNHCFSEMLQKVARRDKKVLLLIDEAQRLTPQLTAEIVALLKLSSHTAGNLHVCLVAQTDADRRSIGSVIKSLGKHITADMHVDPLDASETAAYVRHRQQAAGAVKDLFNDDALQAVFHYSGGYPMQINLVCDYALFSGYAEQVPLISEDIVRWSATSLHLPDIAEKQPDAAGCTAETAKNPGTQMPPGIEAEEKSGEGHGIIIADGPEKTPPRAALTLKSPDAPPGTGLSRPEKQRASFFKTAIAAAAVLFVMGGAYATYTLKTRSAPGWQGHPAPRVSAASSAPAAATGLAPPAIFSGSGKARRTHTTREVRDRRTATKTLPDPASGSLPAAAPPTTDLRAVRKPPPETGTLRSSTDQMPLQPKVVAVPAPSATTTAVEVENIPAESTNPVAPADQPVATAGGTDAVQAAAENKNAPRAVPARAETTAAAGQPGLPGPAVDRPAAAQAGTRIQAAGDANPPVVAAQSRPAAVQAHEGTAAVSGNAALSRVTDSSREPGLQPVPALSPGATRPVPAQAPPVGQTTSGSSALQSGKTILPPPSANGVSTAVRQTAPFAARASSPLHAANPPAETAVRPAPQNRLPEASRRPPPAAGEPDPSAVIDWLLKRKQK